MCITVVVPTFNRARLLPRTIPTYLQEGVERLILVDDASTDETPQVAEELVAKFPGVIQYVRNQTNRKQTYSKNAGKSLADSEYVYFADDDSLMVPGSMAALLETMREQRAGIVGAAAIYCKNGESPDEVYLRYLNSEPVDDPAAFVDLARFRFRFGQRPSAPLLLPVTHAAFLVRREWYASIDFDLRYTGNCYREETDFLLQAYKAGARIFMDGRAVQINLSPAETAGGGARTSGRARYEWYSFSNTARFLLKHKEFYVRSLRVSPARALVRYVADRVTAAFRKLPA